MLPSITEAVLELEAALIAGAIAFSWIVLTDKLPGDLGLKLQKPVVTILLMIVLIIPVFVAVIFLHRYNPLVSYGVLILMAVALPLLFSNWSRRLRAKSALLMAETETMLAQLAEGPGIKHPELDAAILSSRLSLARAKEQLASSERSNKRLFVEAIIAAGLIVTMHCIFIVMGGTATGETLALPELFFRLTFVAVTIFVANKIIDRVKVRNLAGPG